MSQTYNLIPTYKIVNYLVVALDAVVLSQIFFPTQNLERAY